MSRAYERFILLWYKLEIAPELSHIRQAKLLEISYIYLFVDWTIGDVGLMRKGVRL
jgi:hypothetical protein